jgi:hypothetical protein
MNGITFAEAGLTGDDAELIQEIYGNVEVNRLSHEDVVKDLRSLEERSKVKLAGLQATHKEMMVSLAAFIFKNGLHKKLEDRLIVRKQSQDGQKRQLTYGDLKDYFDIRPERKTMAIRYSVGIQSAYANSDASESILKTHARKYGLEDDYEEIEAQFRFFGANLHPQIGPKNLTAYLRFQQKVIKIAGEREK